MSRSRKSMKLNVQTRLIGLLVVLVVIPLNPFGYPQELKDDRSSLEIAAEVVHYMRQAIESANFLPVEDQLVFLSKFYQQVRSDSYREDETLSGLALHALHGRMVALLHFSGPTESPEDAMPALQMAMSAYAEDCVNIIGQLVQEAQTVPIAYFNPSLRSLLEPLGELQEVLLEPDPSPTETVLLRMSLPSGIVSVEAAAHRRGRFVLVGIQVLGDFRHPYRSISIVLQGQNTLTPISTNEEFREAVLGPAKSK